MNDEYTQSIQKTTTKPHTSFAPTAAIRADEIVYFFVEDDLLTDFFIFKGDWVMVLFLKESDPKQITVWETASQRITGWARDEFEGVFITVEAGKVLKFRHDEIKLIGKIIGFVRQFDAQYKTVKPSKVFLN
jgi:hypothetical protein